jgi:hypothetical protein
MVEMSSLQSRLRTVSVGANQFLEVAVELDWKLLEGES